MAEKTENAYFRDAVMTASPEQLQLMLYDGAIRYSQSAREALERRDYEQSYEGLSRAQRIIMEMRSGLNYDVNPELCQRVASIYDFLYRKLVDACVKRSISDIDDALRVLKIERETWQMLVDKVNRVRDLQEADEGSSDPEAETASASATGFSAEA